MGLVIRVVIMSRCLLGIPIGMRQRFIHARAVFQTEWESAAKRYIDPGWLVYCPGRGLRAYPDNPLAYDFMALQSHEIYPISVIRIGSKYQTYRGLATRGLDGRRSSGKLPTYVREP